MSDNHPTAPETTDRRHPMPHAAPRMRNPRLERAKVYFILILIVMPFVIAYAWLKDYLFNLLGAVVAPMWDKLWLAVYRHFGYGALVICFFVMFGSLMYYLVKENWPKRRGSR